MDFKNRWHEYIAGNGFDPLTSGLWAQHASTAPPCFNCYWSGSNPRPSHLSAFGSAYRDNALSNWATGAYICGVIDVPILCKIKNWRSKNRKYSMDSKNRWHEYSRKWFRSIDLWVMGLARFHCATLLQLLPERLEPSTFASLLWYCL